MVITRENLIKSITLRDLSGALLVHGSEPFFFEEILKLLRKSYGGSSWAYEVVDAPSLDSAALTSSAATLSFDAATKVTVIRSAYKLKKDQLEALEKVVSHEARERVVVLLAEKELKSSDNLLGWAKERGLTLCHFSSPKPREVSSWLQAQSSARGFSLDAETLDFMMDISSGNLMGLSQMVAKIDLYRGEKTRIVLKDVEDLLSDSFEKGVYDCVRAVFAKDRVKSSKEMHRVLRFGVENGVGEITRSLAREAFTLLKYIELKKRGVSREVMEKELKLGARKWLLQMEYPERIRKWPKERLHRLLIRLADVDFSLRVSGRDAEAMLEQIVIGNLAPTSVEETDEIFV